MSFSEAIAPRSRPASRSRTQEPALSVDKFDRATLQAAKDVLAGNSRWFRFDEDGTLRTLNAFESMERDAESKAYAMQLREVAQDPEPYKAMLAKIR